MRQAFKMKLKKGFEKEYERRHNELWDEMKESIHAHGERIIPSFWTRRP